MDDLSRLLAVRKQYANANGKESKYPSAIVISITGSCGGGAGSANGRGGGSAGNVGGSCGGSAGSADGRCGGSGGSAQGWWQCWWHW